MNEYIKDYWESGLYDHLQRPDDFAFLMSNRHWTLSEYYLAGIHSLEQSYGDKAYKNYDDWFDALDAALIQAENHFTGRWKDES